MREPTFVHFVIAALTVSLAPGAISASLRGGVSAPPPLQVASSSSGSAATGSARRHKMEDLDKDTDNVRFPHHRSGVGTTRSAPGGYDADRIKSFWRHYHSNTREPKTKPIDREK